MHLRPLAHLEFSEVLERKGYSGMWLGCNCNLRWSYQTHYSMPVPSLRCGACLMQKRWLQCILPKNRPPTIFSIIHSRPAVTANRHSDLQPISERHSWGETQMCSVENDAAILETIPCCILKDSEDEWLLSFPGWLFLYEGRRTMDACWKTHGWSRKFFGCLQFTKSTEKDSALSNVLRKEVSAVFCWGCSFFWGSLPCLGCSVVVSKVTVFCS